MFFETITGFRLRDELHCFSTETKGKVCVRMELNSLRISLGDQHGSPFLYRGANMDIVTSCENREHVIFTTQGIVE